MASVEMIGLLCAGSTRYHEYGGGSGVDRLTRSELAGLLAGLNPAAMNFALAKYALDIAAERILIAQVRVWAAGVAVNQNWEVVKGRPTIVNMSALAVFESVRPNRCCRCSGRGFVANRLCPVCTGSGYKVLSGRKIADAIGVDECCYRRKWKQRYSDVMAYVQGLDATVNRVIGFADRIIEKSC